MFTTQQGYYITFKFLDRYWENVDRLRKYEEEDFTLVTIISTMNPFDVNEPIPVDYAKYEDWETVLRVTFGEKTSFTEREIYEAVLKYVKFFDKEYGFNLNDVIIDLEENDKLCISEMWNEVVEKACNYMKEIK